MDSFQLHSVYTLHYSNTCYSSNIRKPRITDYIALYGNTGICGVVVTQNICSFEFRATKQVLLAAFTSQPNIPCQSKLPSNECYGACTVQ